jgi:hypothetical protein
MCSHKGLIKPVVDETARWMLSGPTNRGLNLWLSKRRQEGQFLRERVKPVAEKEDTAWRDMLPEPNRAKPVAKQDETGART